MRRKKMTAVAVATTAAALALTACGTGSGSTSGSGSGANGTGTLTIGAVVPWSTAEASGSQWANESPYVQAVYDSLLRESPTAQIQPALATSWSYNADKTVLTMKLRKGVKFTDGTPFNAAAAAQNILRFRDGTSTNKSELANVKDATAVDDSTLQITLSEPDPALLTYLAQNAGAQESPKNFNAPDEKTHPVGTGPYILESNQTVIGSKYVYKANPNYWDKADQHFANLVINVYTTVSTQVNALRGGQVDGLNLLDNSAVSQLKAAGFTLYPHELDWTGLILMDRDGVIAPALKDVRVRQAINYAIDNKAMLKGAGQGFGSVTSQVFGKNTTAFDPSLDTAYPYNPTKAKQLLAEAGYANGFSLTMPEVQTGSNARYDLMKQYLGAVGITVNFVPTTVAQVLKDVPAAKYAASYFILQEDPTSWQTAQFEISPTAVFNPFHTTDPKVTSLLKTIQTGSDSDAAAAAKQLNQYIVAQAWFDPWWRVESNYAADKKIHVVQQSDNAVPYLQNITHS